MRDDGGSNRHRAWGSTMLTLLLALGVAVAVGAALLRVLGTGTARWSFAALSFTPYALAGAGVLALVGLAARRWGSCAGAVLAVVVLGTGVLPRAIADVQPEATGPALTVASTNLYYGQADARVVVDLVRSRNVDVLSIQELTPQAVAALGAAGLWQLLPHRLLRPEPRAAGTGLASRYPLQERASSSPSSYHWQPAAVIGIPDAVEVGAGDGTDVGADVEVVAVHTVAPVGRIQPSEWRAELADLPRPLPGSATRLLVGDFNATLDHQPLRTLLDTGYRDAADTLGQGLRATWPTDTSIAPVAAIDHVLVEQACAVRSFETLPLPGSDHRAVVAELVLPG